MDTQTPSPFGIERGRLEHLVALGRRFAACQESYYAVKAELWKELGTAAADLQTNLPELLDMVEAMVADVVTQVRATPGWPAGPADGCGHDHAQDAPAEPVTAADAVELGARQTADELLGAGFSAGLAQNLEDARHQLLDPPGPHFDHPMSQRLPPIGTPQDRVRAALHQAHVDSLVEPRDTLTNEELAARDLKWVQTMTGLNPLTASKALAALVKAGKAVKVDDNNYRFAG